MARGGKRCGFLIAIKHTDIRIKGFVTPQSLVDRGNADLANAPASKIDIGS